MKLFIAGATGNVGFPTVQKLSRQHNIEILALTRNPTSKKAALLRNLPNVTLVEGDLNQPETFGPALEGTERAMLVTPPLFEQLEQEINFINAAIRAKVHFLLKISTTATTMKEDSQVGYARTHLSVEKYLRESDKLPWTALRPNEFMENRLGLAPVIQGSRSFPSAQQDHVAASVSASDVAEIAAGILLLNDFSQYVGKSLVVSGPENVSDQDFARYVSEATGQPVRYHPVSAAEMTRMFYGADVPETVIAGTQEFIDNVKTGKHTQESLPTDDLVLHVHRPEKTLKRLVNEQASLFQ